MRVIIKGMWKYALMQNYVKDDLTQHLVFTSNYIGKQVHTRFTDKEIKQLWDNVDKVKNIDIILIYIYTGLRPTELLDMLTENIHMEERYMVGGIKTEAGRNRIIPIHEAIAPLVQRRLDMNHKYLIISNRGTHYGRSGYQCSNFNKVMKTLGMTHVPHDGRYTFASLADSCEMNQTCRKIIMGHATTNKDGTAFKTGDAYSDLTQGVYTEKTLKQLLDEVNKLPTDFPDAEQPPT
jgi:integrase